MKELTKLTTLGVLACLCCSLVPQTHAASHDILMTANGFVPDYLEVTVGERVYWWNEDYDYFDYHSTRSYSYPWSSGGVPVGSGVYLDTTKTGTYDYVDDWGYSGFGRLVIKPFTPPPPPILTQPVRLGDGVFNAPSAIWWPAKHFTSRFRPT
jgi:plastocyanin